MKRILLLASLVGIAAGCMPTRPESANLKSAAASKPDPAAERKLAEKLPQVTPDSVTPENYQAKLNEFDREMLLESRRLDSAKNVASSAK